MAPHWPANFMNQPLPSLVDCLERLVDWSFSIDGHDRVSCVSGSPARFCLDGTAVLGRPWTALIDVASQPLFHQHLQAARVTPSGLWGPSSMELQLTGGQPRWVELTICRLLVNDQTHWKCLLRDVTELRHYHRALADSNRNGLVTRLAGGVAHDFNNVLAGIMLNAGLLPDTEGEQQQQLVDRILASSERGATLCRNLLTFARQAPSQPEWITLRALLSDVLVLFEPEARRSGVSTSWDATPELVVYANPVLLWQILLNLLFIAVEKPSANGAIDIAATPDQHSIRIVLRETVPSVESERPEDCMRLKAATRVGDLDLCRNLARSMGGEVETESMSDGTITYTLLLPAAGNA